MSEKIDAGMPPVFTVYEKPKDYPDKFVVRRWIGMDPDREPVAIGDTLEDVRAQLKTLNPFLVRLERDSLDDPVILETWI